MVGLTVSGRHHVLRALNSVCDTLTWCTFRMLFLFRWFKMSCDSYHHMVMLTFPRNKLSKAEVKRVIIRFRPCSPRLQVKMNKLNLTIACYSWKRHEMLVKKVGKVILLCSHDPISGTNINRILETEHSENKIFGILRTRLDLECSGLTSNKHAF